MEKILNILRKTLWALIIVSFPFYIGIFIQNTPSMLSCKSDKACFGTGAILLSNLTPTPSIPTQIFKPNIIERIIDNFIPSPNIDINNDFTLPEDINPSPAEQPTPTPEITTQIQKEPGTLFEQILEIIKIPTSGSGSTNTGGGGTLPPIITDCTSTQNAIQNITLSCYRGHRTYNTQILTLTNTNLTSSCQVELSLNNTPNPALINNFTTGNADFYFILSSVEPSFINLLNLPAPEKIGTWTQWHNTPLQVELVNGNLQAANSLVNFTVPANQSRNLGLIVDCGQDTINGESGTINLKTRFFE